MLCLKDGSAEAGYRIQLKTLGEEAFGATVLRLKFGNFHDVSMPRLLCSAQRTIG